MCITYKRTYIATVHFIKQEAKMRKENILIPMSHCVALQYGRLAKSRKQKVWLSSISVALLTIEAMYILVFKTKILNLKRSKD